MTTIRKGYVDTPAGQVHYRTLGTGEPVVLLHMSPASSAMWEPALPHLAARGYQAFALDTPGYGDSFRPPAPPSLEEYAAYLLAALDGLGLTRFLLVGHHTGGLIGAVLASQQPKRVRKFACWGFTLMEEKRKAELRQLPLASYDEEGEALLARWRSRRAMAGERWTPALGIRQLLETLQAGRELPWGFWAVGQADHLAIARSLTVPTLVLCGERDTHREQSQQAVHLMRQARFQPLPGCSLNVVDEAPEELVAALAAFFQEPVEG